MKYTLRTAAEACGISKTAIHNAIKSGRLSAPKNDNGGYEIDPAELHRVFPPVHIEQQRGQDLTDRDSIENAYLRDKIALLENMLDDIKGDRDHWRNQATMLLTHQPELHPETPKAEQPTPSLLYEKLFGRR
jgi:hypothetical protein